MTSSRIDFSELRRFLLEFDQKTYWLSFIAAKESRLSAAVTTVLLTQRPFRQNNQERHWGFSTPDDSDTWRLVTLWEHPVTITFSSQDEDTRSLH